MTRGDNGASSHRGARPLVVPEMKLFELYAATLTMSERDAKGMENCSVSETHKSDVTPSLAMRTAVISAGTVRYDVSVER